MNPASIDIVAMLEAESSLGLTFKTDIFIGTEPKEPDNCVTIYDTPSYPPSLTMNKEERYYYSSYQIRVRNNSYAIGMALARDILVLLHGRANESWNGTLYTVIHATGEPALLDNDGNNRSLIVFNINSQRR